MTRETEGVEGVRDERRCEEEEEEVKRRHEVGSWGERWERQQNEGKSRGCWK